MEYIVYQQRGEQSPTRISNHRNKSDAIRSAEALLGQWRASGVNPPSIFAAWNGVRSIEVWRDGNEVAVFPEQPTKPRKTLAELSRHPSHPLRNARRVCPKCKGVNVAAPSYPGDWFDCLDCGHSIASTPKQIKAMHNALYS